MVFHAYLKGPRFIEISHTTTHKTRLKKKHYTNALLITLESLERVLYILSRSPYSRQPLKMLRSKIWILLLGSLAAVSMGCTNKAADECIAYLGRNPKIECCQRVQANEYICKTLSKDACTDEQKQFCRDFILNKSDGTLGACKRVNKGTLCQRPKGDLCKY